MRRIAQIIRNISREMLLAQKHLRPASFLRYSADIVAYRTMALHRPRHFNAERRIRLKTGQQFFYRLNRGDIQTVREVWFDDVYRLPFDLPGSGGTLVDLGGNIGLTSIYLAQRHTFDHVVLVEPVPENLRLARLNCALNGVNAEFVAAAIGPNTGEVSFMVAENHNLGRIDTDSDDTLTVPMATMDEVTGTEEPIRLVKMDIEGGEAALLQEAPEWLNRVDALIAEFHPTLVDYPGLVRELEERDFTFFPPGSSHPATDSFRSNRLLQT
jgi:FkbM family methyltransferase